MIQEIRLNYSKIIMKPQKKKKKVREKLPNISSNCNSIRRTTVKLLQYHRVRNTQGRSIQHFSKIENKTNFHTRVTSIRYYQ